MSTFPASPTAQDERCNALFTQVATELRGPGYIVIDNALPLPLANALHKRVVSLREQGEMTEAGIGRGSDHMLATRVRQDSIHWLENSEKSEAGWITAMEKLRLRMNQELLLGLFSYESHFAHYAPGQAYKKHLDAFRGQSNRVLSTVYYLNPDWQPGQGGELRIYDEADTELETIAPLFNRLVIFLSEEFPHEVLPGSFNRNSIAGWFRVNTSTALAVDPPR